MLTNKTIKNPRLRKALAKTLLNTRAAYKGLARCQAGGEHDDWDDGYWYGARTQAREAIAYAQYFMEKK